MAFSRGYNSGVNRSAIENRIRKYLGSCHEDVAAVYLFGSVSRGDSVADSDIDVGVLLPCDPPSTLEGLLLSLQGGLERNLGRSVDLVVLNRAPIDLIHRVLRDGKLLLDLDPSRRIRFEVKARNEFFDLQPILEEYRRPRTGSS